MLERIRYEAEDEFYEKTADPLMEKLMSGKNPIYIIAGFLVLLIVVVIALVSPGEPKKTVEKDTPVNPEIEAHNRKMPSSIILIKEPTTLRFF